LQVRRANIASALTSYLSLANLTDFNATQYLVNITSNASFVPTSGLAISGGGYVSFLTGLGAYQAMDARFPAAVEAKTGGLAQCLTYLTGLSGGSVAVSALAGNNFPTVEGLFAQVNTLESPFIGPNSSNVNNYYEDIFEEVGLKAEMGFNVSLADVLGIIFSQNYQVGSNDTISRTWSDIQVHLWFLERG
jgi:lysophospholipase